jgi:hypothetical protein
MKKKDKETILGKMDSVAEKANSYSSYLSGYISGMMIVLKSVEMSDADFVRMVDYFINLVAESGMDMGGMI